MHCPPHWHPLTSGKKHSTRFNAIARIVAITNGVPRPSCEPCAMWSSQDLRHRPEQKKRHRLLRTSAVVGIQLNSLFTWNKSHLLAPSRWSRGSGYLELLLPIKSKTLSLYYFGLRVGEEKNLFMLCCHTCPGDRKHRHLAGWVASIVHTVTRSKNSRCLSWLSSMLFSESLNMFSHTLCWNPAISE